MPMSVQAHQRYSMKVHAQLPLTPILQGTGVHRYVFLLYKQFYGNIEVCCVFALLSPTDSFPTYNQISPMLNPQPTHNQPTTKLIPTSPA
jgi:hypothetical protein